MASYCLCIVIETHALRILTFGIFVGGLHCLSSLKNPNIWGAYEKGGIVPISGEFYTCVWYALYKLQPFELDHNQFMHGRMYGVQYVFTSWMWLMLFYVISLSCQSTCAELALFSFFSKLLHVSLVLMLC